MVFDLYYSVWRIKNVPISSSVLSHVPQTHAACLLEAGDKWKEGSPRECCLLSNTYH